MKIEIWSDFVCPFCYLGETRMALGLEKILPNEPVEIHFRSFQLNPEAVKVVGKDIHQLIAEKYHLTYEQSKANSDAIQQAAAAVGLNYRFDLMQPNNTALAHKISKIAASKGLEKPVVDRFFKAYFEEGADIGDLDTLKALAIEAGLTEEVLSNELSEAHWEQQVLNDMAEARTLGINSVPFFVINGQYGISGAQSPEYFVSAFRDILSKSGSGEAFA